MKYGNFNGFNNCQYCGDLFGYERRDQKFCCGGCKQAAYRERNDQAARDRREQAKEGKPCEAAKLQRR